MTLTEIQTLYFVLLFIFDIVFEWLVSQKVLETLVIVGLQPIMLNPETVSVIKFANKKVVYFET
jgi:hypothetical protein